MGLEEIKSDAKFNRQRIAGLDLDKLDRGKLVEFVKTELAENVYPFLEAFAEAVQKDLGVLEETVGEIDEAVDALEDAAGDEDVLHPETAQQILGVLQLGRAIAIEVSPLVVKGAALDDSKRKRLRKMLSAFRQGVEVVAEIVVAITVKPEPEDPDAAAADAADAADAEDAEPGAAAEPDGEDEDGDDDDDGFDAPGEG